MADTHDHGGYPADVAADYDGEPYDDDGLYEEAPWSPRRQQATVAVIVATGLFLVSVVVAVAFSGVSEGLESVFDIVSFGTWITIFTVLLVGVIAWLLVLYLASGQAPVDDEGWYDEEPVDAHDPYAGEPVVDAIPETMTLRCPKCTNVFNLQDTGVRPLRHACPHCGVHGTLE